MLVASAGWTTQRHSAWYGSRTQRSRPTTLRQRTLRSASQPTPEPVPPALLPRSASSDFPRPRSLRCPGIRLNFDLQLHSAALLTTQLHTIHNEKQFVPLQRVNETRNLQVVAGNVGIHFLLLQSLDFRLVSLVSHRRGPHPGLLRNLAEVRRDGRILRRKPLTIELFNLLLCYRNLLVKTSPRRRGTRLAILIQLRELLLPCRLLFLHQCEHHH